MSVNDVMSVDDVMPAVCCCQKKQNKKNYYAAYYLDHDDEQELQVWMGESAGKRNS